ncbi:MAG: hypothetical protein PVF79_11835 [Desulfobacterales bacterium]|jgi:hypothetical protein
MTHLLSFIFFLLLPIGIGVVIIYLAIDFFEYLGKNHRSFAGQMSFASIFGIPAEKFIFHLIKPVEFTRFVFSKEDLDDNNVVLYKKRIKICMLALAGWLVVFILFRIVF